MHAKHPRGSASTRSNRPSKRHNKLSQPVARAIAKRALGLTDGKPTQKPESLTKLDTERRNPAALDLDLKSVLEVCGIINSEDAKVAAAVKLALPQIAEAIDLISASLQRGGRLIYVGAGTSGRIAALDASECPPTFGTDPNTVQFVIAGGIKALAGATEGSEDSRQLGRRDMARKKPGREDVIVGIAASGRTPFTVAAIQYARSRGAKTIAVTCNRRSVLEKAAHHAIVTEVGPEVISGSTRMKAGTAQKMVLNMLSTGVMIRLGYVYGNLMINVHVKNKKLLERGLTILQLAAAMDDPDAAGNGRTASGGDGGAAGISRAAAARALHAAHFSVPVAVLMLRCGLTREAAIGTLRSAAGNIRAAMAKASRA